ncbi:dual specificity protein kinase pom1 [Ophiostoma piceae UAMH 11346]|uniref:Dual specificity protein kinase pom1 n=1 Tax=Ophiostoma piceae (strain UAMH 11346) TaxID=1262450 RepID=S3CU35_OPHP1|nr:dual specificity protein kinase pom1 [Ophiostoma piceae UAMH 11346]
MLNASSSNNHSIFSFGRSNGTSATATSSSKLPPPMIHTSNDQGHDEELYNNGEDNPPERSIGFEFLPSVSFDDLQSSLESASTEFKLAQFPSPSGQGSILGPQGIVDKMVEQASSVSYGDSSAGGSGARPTAVAAAAAAATASANTAANANTRISIPQSSTTPAVGSAARVSKSNSILRRPSISTRQSLSSSTSSNTILDNTTVPASSRQRRQSHYPPVSNTNIAKPPRKSVGPGVFEPEYNTGVSRTTSRRRPSLASNSDQPVTGSARSSLDGGSRLGINGNDTLRNPSGSRASKARSFQNVASSRASMSAVQDPTKAAGAGFPRPPRTVSHSNSTGNFSSSVNGNAKLSTPAQSSASKRMSMAPALHASHATGLGARTVSPTDTRRMKRMSIMPTSTSSNGNSASNSRDVTQTSTVPLPTPNDARASSRSPSMLPRKSSTPSSSRTTPDPNRKSYSSGFSVGSTMSLNTARTSTGSIQPRLPQGTALSGSGIAGTGSRLPAPKALTMLNPAPSTDDDEYVPPVPAIPKAYESPKGSPAELSFLEKRKSNLAFDTSSTHSSSTASISGSQQLGLDPPAKIQRKSSLQAAKDSDKMNHTTTGVSLTNNKKNLQSLRLPPINLQPLSKPTTAKIAALQDQSAAIPDRSLSPPPSRIIAKTPTTPMTASKGSFFSRHRNEDHSELNLAIRSNSSVYHHTRTDSANDGDDTSSSEMFTGSVVSKKSSFQKPSISPYLSTSAPRSGGMDPSYFKTPRTPAEDNDNAYTTPFATPAPPPIPASATSTARKPSGPRAPAPTPSRAFAPIESASTIIGSGETSFLMDPMPSLKPVATHASKSPPPDSSPEEPPTPSSIGSSLRRKLSLSWKRNNSKSSLSMQGSAVSEKASDPSFTDSKRRNDNNAHTHSRRISSIDKHDGMPPPPRIPKSATMSHVSSTKKSPTPAAATSSKASASYLESRRRKSSASSLNAVLSNEKPKNETWTASERSHRKDGAPTAADGPTGASAGQTHVPSVSHKILHSKHSTASIRHRHDVWSTELDADDMIAEEEIRKLGSRRKETGIAARTLDALRKRATPKERVSAYEATRIAMLNIYERGEIVDYEDVYFCGTQNAAKVVGSPNSDKPPNFGYDDERGDYAIVAGDHLAYRYEIIDLLGKGSFGQVVRCIDHKTGVLVAVKIIRNKKRFHQQALVEVNILQKLREWDPKNKHSMVNFTHSFYFRGHLCISTELLDMNLYEFIKANAFRGFSVKLIRRFTKQMLSSLMLLKQHKVIHCDLKPENVLLRHPLHTEIKVIDFGSSCFENERVYTYIQSRFYRSPEVILGMTYGMPIDMWSLGCILAELFTGVPIFPGENEQEQLACIMEVFGPPEKHLIEKSTRKKLFFDSMGKPRLTVSSKGRRRRPSSKTLQQVIKCDDEAFLDFLARCMRWDPDRRLKPEEAIRHEFITGQKTVIPPPMSRSTLSTRDGSPVRRQHAVSISGTSGPRPLPDPPSAKIGPVPTLRSGGARESLGVSSHKSMNGTSGSSRRTSAVTSSTVASMGKRATAATGVGAGASTAAMVMAALLIQAIFHEQRDVLLVAARWAAVYPSLTWQQLGRQQP